MFVLQRYASVTTIMGLIQEGKQLSWSEIKANRELIRKLGVKQFIYLHKKFKDRTNDSFLWGDETEHTLVRFNHEQKCVQLLLKADELIPKLQDEYEKLNISERQTAFHSEFSSYVVEGTPAKPFTDYCTIEANMKLRRQQVQRLLDENEYILNISVFPRMGTRQFTYPPATCDQTNSVEHSIFCPEDVISTLHPKAKNAVRYLSIPRAGQRNVRERIKSSKMVAYVPVYIDKNTHRPFRDYHSVFDHKDLLDDHIYLDCASFGWGSCCLQVTFQTESLNEAEYLYDQLAPIAPIM
ncbi:unnamed protein product, partial [Didymodactylos carnosus]